MIGREIHYIYSICYRNIVVQGKILLYRCSGSSNSKCVVVYVVQGSGFRV
jgi:hypothetical protein